MTEIARHVRQQKCGVPGFLFLHNKKEPDFISSSSFIYYISITYRRRHTNPSDWIKKDSRLAVFFWAYTTKMQTPKIP